MPSNEGIEMVKVAINGFGRIGRHIVRAIHQKKSKLEVVAVNDITDAKTLAHLLKYDSTYGIFNDEVKASEKSISVAGKDITVLTVKDPAQLPWKSMGVDYVVESTGLFTEAPKAAAHITAGAKRVVISAPAKGEDLTVVMGVNEQMYDPQKHHILSNASCTTNCLAPVAKVLFDNFGIKKAQMTTIHAYTMDQRLLDAPHRDLRRARASAVSMIPTTTGAAKALALVMPQLKGKFDGISIRVPTQTVSLVDLVAELEKDTTVEAINAAFRKEAAGKMKGYLAVSDEPLVSVDFRGNTNSSIVDSAYTMMVGANFVKVLSWYDNEWGYANRVVDLLDLMASKE
jgi:glyceraldehyde 3-phosphate dehydrogenase